MWLVPLRSGNYYYGYCIMLYRMQPLHDRDTFGETPLFSAASGIRRDDVSSNENLSKHEDFIYFLLDQGCSVCDSNIYITQSQEDSQSLNSCPELKRTVLGAAVPNASYKLTSRLIAEGAEVHAWQKMDGSQFVGSL